MSLIGRHLTAAPAAGSGSDPPGTGVDERYAGWSPVAGIGLSWLIPRRSLRVAARLAALGVSVLVNVRTLHPGLSGAGAVVLVALTVATAAWLTWIATPAGGLVGLGALVAMGAAGGVASATGPAGYIFVGVAAAGTASVCDLIGAAGLAAAGPAAFVADTLARGAFPDRLALTCAVGLVGLVTGASRREQFDRGRQATLLAVADKRAAVAQDEAALVAERNRLGRELHDVLAHTLGALSVQLSALDTLVEGGADRARVRGQIEDTHRLVDEGLEEVHQAVRALRDHPQPLVDELVRLCRQHAATFEVAGTPRPLLAPAHLALYRVAQEALTNAGRHAPGAEATVQVAFGPDAVMLTVNNPIGSRPPGRPTTGGYGLAGMRERVLLAAGRCDAGPVGDHWQVTAQVPA